MKIELSNSPISFNSRPHKEVDRKRQHFLARRLSFQFTTSQGGRPKTMVYGDIFHDFQFTTSQGGRLYWSTSFKSVFLPFNSRPHKEVDIFPKKILIVCIFFQFTTSQGGRRLQGNETRESHIFQFTTSQGGRPNMAIDRHTSELFQFTTSQGGRRNSAGCRDLLLPFNSRPHKEVDRK